MLISASGGADSPRVGVVVGRQVGGAVDRNRVKRRIREAMARAGLKGNRDYVVIAKRPARRASVEDLVAWVAEVMEV